MKKIDIKRAKGIEILRSTFGDSLDFKVPEDCDLVILAGNKGGGYVPYTCLLPHQVYVEDIKEEFKKSGWEVIYVIPINSKLPFPIVFNGDYGQQRWEKE